MGVSTLNVGPTRAGVMDRVMIGSHWLLHGIDFRVSRPSGEVGAPVMGRNDCHESFGKPLKTPLL
jgi:hypothetical protein